MTKALMMAIQRAVKEAKNLRGCVRCGHFERACICHYPIWVSHQEFESKSLLELRKLPYKKIKVLKEPEATG